VAHEHRELEFRYYPTVLARHIQSHLRHNKLRTLHEDRHDNETSQSFWKSANHVFEAEDSFIVLTTEEIITSAVMSALRDVSQILW